MSNNAHHRVNAPLIILHSRCAQKRGELRTKNVGDWIKSTNNSLPAFITCYVTSYQWRSQRR